MPRPSLFQLLVLGAAGLLVVACGPTNGTSAVDANVPAVTDTDAADAALGSDLGPRRRGASPRDHRSRRRNAPSAARRYGSTQVRVAPPASSHTPCDAPESVGPQAAPGAGSPISSAWQRPCTQTGQVHDGGTTGL